MRYCFDMDGTICSQAPDYALARPNLAVIEGIRALKAAGHEIIIFTARGSGTGRDWRAITEAQLVRWHVAYDELVFGKPPADVYVDDRAIATGDFEPHRPAVIVAEIGINHNGDLEKALLLIDAAKEAGADFVKFQKREPRLAVPRDQWAVSRETPWGPMSYIEYKERLEFGAREFDIIDAYCGGRGIAWFASPWDVASVEFLQRYDLPMLKIASASITDEQLLWAVQATGKRVVISTGMSTLDEVRRAAEVLGDRLETICHCNSTYPCPPQDLNLRCIQTLRALFPGKFIGYSGHEVGLATSVAAVAMGATYIERHITLDRSAWGTDQAASVEPGGFARMVRDIRTVELGLGDGEKRVTSGELPVMAKLRGVKA